MPRPDLIPNRGQYMPRGEVVQRAPPVVRTPDCRVSKPPEERIEFRRRERRCVVGPPVGGHGRESLLPGLRLVRVPAPPRSSVLSVWWSVWRLPAPRGYAGVLMAGEEILDALHGEECGEHGDQDGRG